MDGIVVDGQQGEPDVVRLRDRPPERVTVDVSHLEVLEYAPLPTFLDSHDRDDSIRRDVIPPMLPLLPSFLIALLQAQEATLVYSRV